MRAINSQAEDGQQRDQAKRNAGRQREGTSQQRRAPRERQDRDFEIPEPACEAMADIECDRYGENYQIVIEHVGRREKAPRGERGRLEFIRCLATPEPDQRGRH